MSTGTIKDMTLVVSTPSVLIAFKECDEFFRLVKADARVLNALDLTVIIAPMNDGFDLHLKESLNKYIRRLFLASNLTEVNWKVTVKEATI